MLKKRKNIENKELVILKETEENDLFKKIKEISNILLIEETEKNCIIPSEIEKLKIDIGNLQKSIACKEIVTSRII